MYFENAHNPSIQSITDTTADLIGLMTGQKLLWSDVETAIGRPMHMDKPKHQEIALRYLKRKATDIYVPKPAPASPGVADTLASALQTIATAFQLPCKPTRKQLDAMARTVLEITACPAEFDADSARTAIYTAFGHDVA